MIMATTPSTAHAQGRGDRGGWRSPMCSATSGRVLWANLFLLFWLSLVPFVIRWIDEAGFKPFPVAAYGVVLAMAAIGYTLLQSAIIARNGRSSALATAVGTDLKGKLSLAMYIAAVPLAFVKEWIAIVLYIAVALLWLVPDRRIESTWK